MLDRMLRLSSSTRARLGGMAHVAADGWALLKFVLACLAAPLAVPVVAWRAARNHALAKERIRAVPAQIAALERGEGVPWPGDRVRRVPDHRPLFVSSDLHRCYPGRRDVCERQDVKLLYAALVDHYDAAGWDVVENGDVEDHWMVGGSPYGQWYDAAWLVSRLLPGALGRSARRAIGRRHVRLIMENNVAVARRLARLGRAGRYHRTVGNHDDAYLDRKLSDDLAARSGGSQPVDVLVLERPDGSASAIITHGHQTDGWNAAERAGLGRLATWFGCTIADVPGLESPDSVLPMSATLDLLEGRLPNRLLQVHRRFGANTKYDSVDEELLFDSFGGATSTGPWFLLGHTHLPVMQPLSRTGVPWRRYVNGGSGTWAGMVTGIEWTGGDAPEPRLVAWVWADIPGGADLLPTDAVRMPVGAREVVRVVLRRTGDGRHVLIDPAASAAAASDRSAVAAR